MPVPRGLPPCASLFGGVGTATQPSIDEDGSEEPEQDHHHHADAGDGEEGTAPDAAPAADPGPCLLVVTSQGVGKRVPLKLLRWGPRPSVGFTLLQLAPGDVLAAALAVQGGDDVLVGSRGGVVTRFAAADVSVQTRGSRGVALMAVDEGDSVAVATVVPAGARARGAAAAGAGGHT